MNTRLNEIAEQTSKLTAELITHKVGRPTRYIATRRIQIQKELDILYKEADLIFKGMTK